jgi:predicted Zn-dependent protease
MNPLQMTCRRLMGLLATALVILTGFTLSGCASLDLGDVLEIAQKSAPAVQKSFEDITPEQEYYIGRAVAATILSQYQPYADTEPTEYLNLLGRTLAYASDRPETFGGYHFLILDSQEINAFAAPGGLIFISRGLLACADSEDTVAAILAHEIAHVVEQHGLQAIKKSRVTSALTSVAIATAQTAGSDELAKLTTVFEDSIDDITATLVNSGYSRTFEKEADLMAVEILQRVGYDPNALVRMLEVMERRLTPGGLDFAKTHPEPQVRIREIRTVLAEAPAPPVQAARQARYQAALGNL